MEFAKVTSKGQVTIPVETRKQLNIEQGDQLLFYVEDKKMIVINVSKNINFNGFNIKEIKPFNPEALDDEPFDWPEKALKTKKK